ncbi:ribonuclease E [Jatrophihabitans endophyticus]|uniref:Ribonuclease E n=1 Tax=Jatrophihabitans endophyticus TaxID=1206085 RepID=A0A1M5K548_9ACTN|nr:Rne/Rng family ribonuclease [Jatrophihabitans endophyticus]SHG47363.1 ribonuclease E [Jatrophihabitans endophyticus]
MLESDDSTTDRPTDSSPADAPDATPPARAPRKRAPRKAAAKAGPPPVAEPAEPTEPGTPATGDGSHASAGITPGAAAPDAADVEPTPPPRKRGARTAAAKKAAPQVETDGGDIDAPAAPAKKAPAKRARRTAKAQPSADTTADAAAAPIADAAAAPVADAAGEPDRPADAPAPAKKAPRKRAAKKALPPAGETEPGSVDADPAVDPAGASDATVPAGDESGAATSAPGVLFLAPDAEEPAAPAPRRRAARKTGRSAAKKTAAEAPADTDTDTDTDTATGTAAEAPVPAAGDEPQPTAATADTVDSGEAVGVPDDEDDDEGTEPEDVREVASEQASGARRRRRRGRRGRGGRATTDDGDDRPEGSAGAEDSGEGSAEGSAADADTGDTDADTADTDADAATGETSSSRRRRRRRRSGSSDDDGSDDPPNTVTHVRDTREGKKKDDGDDGVRGVKGSTRLEAKRQRRRDGRDTSRRRAPILTESEFLARREAVDRVMAVRQLGDRTQIAVLEDDVLVEHYVTRASATSYVGNVYLGRVQNVLPSMEAAFIDIGKGRNGVLYAGEVNWDAAGLEGKSRAIEQALKSGDSVLVQVTKDPIGHKGARLTSQISLPGRFLVYVPGGGMTGISRRLPDTERHRLKAILKKIVPEDAGVIVRTAAEGASEDDLTRDVERLQAQWEAIRSKSEQRKSAPVLVHGEPDLAIRVVRDVFNEDFQSLVVEGDEAWQTVSEYVGGVAPDLAERVSRHTKDTDLFHDLRVDEQLMKALDRKVWLPSGGSLVIDRTEAMTVVDVNTGKFVGSGGNLEQTVTRNNLEAAEEIVRQLRLRDVGGIVVIDFIDMVLESNRELVLRRLTECLGRDRTKHQVAEVTSLGLVQMTRKRVGEGLLEAFSEPCEHCRGRGVIVHAEPVDEPAGGAASSTADDDRPKGKRRRGRGSGGSGGSAGAGNGAAPDTVELPPAASDEQRKAASAAIAAIHRAAGSEDDAADADDAGSGGEVAELASGLVQAVMRIEPAASTPPTSNGSAPARPVPDEQPVVDGQPVVDEQPAAAPAGSGRRRRRAASRPAGPPGGPS